MGQQRGTMKRKAPATAGVPTPLPGMEGLTASTEARLIWWATCSRLHGAGGCWLAAAAIATATYGAWATRPLGTGTAVATFAVVVVVFLAVAPLYIAAVLLLTNAHRRWRGWLVGYFTLAATQLVHPDRVGTWILTDHFARRRGHGLAAPFRRQVFAHLAAEADATRQ